MSRSPSRRFALLPLHIAVLAALTACAGKNIKVEDEPTLKVLRGRSVIVAEEKGIQGSLELAIEAYRKFLDVAPTAAPRSEVMRRLGDLEMDRAERRIGEGKGKGDVSDYQVAIKGYQDLLKAYPNDPGNDRVLYQLARAHDEGGALDVVLKTLDRLVRDFPNTKYWHEAQFRRGEILFTMRDYPKAEQAYAIVLQGRTDSAYHERALYMQGWSMFKQGRLEDALHPFFGVLDLKVAGEPSDAALDSLPSLTRTELELVEDTFRVASLSLANLQGAESIPPYINSSARRSYEFRIYQHLGELYLKQDRIKDAADTFAAFVRNHPMHSQAPVLQARVINIYQRSGFANLALEAKKEYVAHYGVGSELRRSNPQSWGRAQVHVKAHLAELARYYHASAQKSKARADYEEAVRWYRAYVDGYPDDPNSAPSNFLLAELLFEHGKLADAALEYEKTAYQYPLHAKSADAGYAALLAYAKQEKRAAADAVLVLRREGVSSALRFAKAFAADPRTGPVLTNAAETLFAQRDLEQASNIAEQVLALQPVAASEQRRIAWTVIGHAAFERYAFEKAENAYAEVLALTPANDRGRDDVVERLAASVYKQGEQARDADKQRDAIAHFNRIALLAPTSTVRAAAQYDAATALLRLKDWDGAARVLEDFRQRFPKHALQEDVGTKLAVAYLEKGQWSVAAGEFERVAATKKDPAVVRAALWNAAELHQKAANAAGPAERTGKRSAAARAYERYVKQFPEPIEPALEARWRLAKMAKEDGNAARELALMKEIWQADRGAGQARTTGTKTLGGLAALALVEPAAHAYREVALVEPLQKNLKLKKAKLEEVLKAYGAASEYGVAEVTTAATFHTAALYRDFGNALMTSQRPKKLSKTELEQYNVMLEEQAFPFEEKAAELHEINARRSADGVYDQWVKSSFAALAELRPLRYRKSERSEVVIDAFDEPPCTGTVPRDAAPGAVGVAPAGCSTPGDSLKSLKDKVTGEGAAGSAAPQTAAAAAAARPAAMPKVAAKADPAAEKVDHEPEVSPAARRAFDEARRAMRAGNQAEAERAFRALTISNPELGGPHANLGLIYRQAGTAAASVAEFEKAVLASPRQPIFHNQLGIAHRLNGQFKKARQAYEKAIELDAGYAAPYLNLGILHDLYLWEGRRALELYTRYLALSPGGDMTVMKWVADLKNRKPQHAMLSREEKE